MSYTKTTWTDSTRVSASNLNTLETQYDEVMTLESTWNDHTSRYYTKSTAVVKFYNSAFMGHNSGADADLLDGHHASDLIGTGLPVNFITWWSKDSGSIPTGWYICDGGHSTPDLRDRFVIGASATYSLASLYGVSSVTPASGATTIGSTALDATQIASHTHSWTETHGVYSGDYNYSGFGYDGTHAYYSSTTAARTTDSVGSGGSHTHPSSWVVFNSQANIPPYYAVYLIQRKA